MLKIVAIAPEDGWAFVVRNGETLLIRPPYAQSSLMATSEEASEGAVQKYGFEALDKDFSDWGSLLEYLRGRLSERQKKEVAPVSEFAPEILGSAPKELKAKMLARIGKELIPNREWKAALLLLRSMQKSRGTMDDPELRNMVLDMLEDCAEGMLRWDLGRRKLTQEGQDLANQFPILASAQDPNAVKRLAEDVAEKHQVFNVGVRAA
ncbi:MAG TPA: hypothetical protein VNX26_03265 [Candidatus Acidoferrum sp.]|jgi:hypothetical protein|nr:hypothetical protein [Candidatus Acidoferrum sp.]